MPKSFLPTLRPRSILAGAAPVATALAIAATFLVLWLVPPWEVEQLRGVARSRDDFAGLVNDYRATWAQAIGGLALLSGLCFTWMNLQVSRDEKITARFSQAIEHL